MTPDVLCCRQCIVSSAVLAEWRAGLCDAREEAFTALELCEANVVGPWSFELLVVT